MFDKVQVLKLVENDKEVYKNIVEIYVNEWPVLFEEIKQHIDNNSLDEAERKAHKLKGNLKNFYAETCVDLAQKLEVSCHNKETDAALECLEQLGPQCKELEKQLLISVDEI